MCNKMVSVIKLIITPLSQYIFCDTKCGLNFCIVCFNVTMVLLSLHFVIIILSDCSADAPFIGFDIRGVNSGHRAYNGLGND